ncbi:MAG TPA: malate dehydrogenase, partial [Dehalococcoidia bacterium]|nr:malate dehydrogenase [Dehalococcoidia bacterium]
ANIVRGVAQNALRHSPQAIIIIFANPMDAMCHVAMQAMGVPRNRIVGQGGMLDSTRFRTFIGWETGASAKDVHGYVLGGHTDVTMVPIVSNAAVSGIPLRQLVPQERIDALVERTRKAGTEIVGLLGTSAWFAPAVATLEMVDAILLDRKRMLPCAVYLQGEYGIRDAFVGVMAQLGAGGVEKVIEVALEPEEVAGLHKAADAVRELVGLVRA